MFLMKKEKKTRKMLLFLLIAISFQLLSDFYPLYDERTKREQRWYATICRLAYVGGCAVAHHTLYLSKNMMRTAPVVLAKFILRTIF